MNDIKPSTPIPLPAYYINDKVDEISLVDLFLVLFRRKNTILVTILACSILAVLVTFVITEKTTFTTSIKIGGMPAIESNLSALTKLNESYIPITTNTITDGNVMKNLEVTTRAPDNSNLVVLETTTLTGNQDYVKELHQKISQQFLSNHNQKLTLQQAAIKNQITRLQASLESISNSAYLTTLRTDVIYLRKQYLSSEDISDSLKLNIKDELRFLQNKLIAEEQATNMKTIDLQSNINDLRYKLEIMPETSLISVALKSDSKRTSSLMIIALGIILGGIMGIFAAFIVEIFSKVKAENNKEKALKEKNSLG